MALPSTGWLSDNPSSEEVLPAVLPESFISQYVIGTDDFISVFDPLPSAINVRFGDCVIVLDHGVSEDGTQYGLIAKIIRKGAFGSILLDTLTIPEVAIAVIVKEFCPEPFDKVIEICPETTDGTLSLESTLLTTNQIDESALTPLTLDVIELPCGVLLPILFNGVYKFDGSWQFL